MGMDSMLPPPIPDLAIVEEVIRLDDDHAAARRARRPAGFPAYGADDIDQFLGPIPERDALLEYLARLPDETLAGLYGLHRVCDLPTMTATEAMERYRVYFELANLPIFRPHGAIDLVAKGQLADGLRRGLEQLGLATDPDAAGGNMPDTTRRTVR